MEEDKEKEAFLKEQAKAKKQLNQLQENLGQAGRRNALLDLQEDYRLPAVAMAAGS